MARRRKARQDVDGWLDGQSAGQVGVTVEPGGDLLESRECGTVQMEAREIGPVRVEAPKAVATCATATVAAAKKPRNAENAIRRNLAIPTWNLGEAPDSKVVQVAVRAGGCPEARTCAGMHVAATNTWWALRLWPDCGWNPIPPSAQVIGWRELDVHA